LSEGEIGWQEELRIDHRRHLRSAALVSLALHGVVFAALTVAPSPSMPPLPEVLSVELVAAPPGPARPPAAGPKPKPAPRADPPPAPAPAPPPPPPPKAQVEVLPEQAPVRVEKVVPPEPKPAPDPPKPKPAPKVEPKPRPAPRPEPAPELSYEEAMASLDDEIGVDETSELLAPPTEKRPERSDAADSTAGGPEQASGTFVSPELAAWSRATRRRIQSVWVTPPSFRGRGLVTHLEIQLAASGEVLGEPRVVRSSGDPYFDDNAVRAVLRASPLPPPPKPGAQDFLFRSEAN
jgi:colicin import membrane protein